MSLKIETKDSFIWSDDMDWDTYGIVLDGHYANSVIYKSTRFEGDNFMYVIFVQAEHSKRVFVNPTSSENFRCHVKPLAAGSKITIEI